MKKSLISLLLSSLSLGGCVGLEVTNAVIQSGNTVVSDLVSVERMTVVSNELDSASPATYKPFHYRSGQDCTFSSLIVPYEQTWSEETRQGDGNVTVRLPEPGKIAGYIAVVYKKSCPGLPDEPVLRAGRQATITGTGSILTRAFSVDKTTYFMNTWDAALNSQNMLIVKEAEQPKWWPQVIQRMVRLTSTDTGVKAALVYCQQFFIQANPNHADAIRASIE